MASIAELSAIYSAQAAARSQASKARQKRPLRDLQQPVVFLLLSARPFCPQGKHKEAEPLLHKTLEYRAS